MSAYMFSQYGTVPLPHDILRKHIEQWISVQENNCIDKAFSAQFPWRETGLSQDYFLQRKLCIEGKNFLTGPRYMGGDINCPFIDIVASDSDVDKDVFRVISKEWAEMKPQLIRILTPGHQKPLGTVDQLFYASPLSSASQPQSDNSVKVRLATYAELSWCRQSLSEAYQNTWSTNPGLAGSLFAIDDDELGSHISAGHAYVIMEYGVRVGLIICEEGKTVFLPSFRISEEFILPAFRGRSLASRAQRILCRHLYHTTQKVSLLTGSIIPQNLASIKAAEKAGRTCILRYHFIPVGI
ncbi:hypothetical protein RHD99_13350 [Buttiauxella selenatireducens]|uniref:N-acetyltransferase domain-containing protein n=1 Tax=Buttiauxella selenatireducens TaxID=3073902 RepID=A0ABY9SJY6_9ENTR|nr:hypothetical protein [Buttiauxella sp. R73]WMY76731.1 hypothetical protein RHD99_13350 [Buttiauxella sp. R73]